MSTISTKSPCCANRAGDEADVEARGPDPGPEPIVPAHGGGRSGPKGPGHPEGGVPGSTFAALLQEPNPISATCSRTPPGRGHPPVRTAEPPALNTQPPRTRE